MTVKTTRKIVKIDEEKCTGCGACVPNCVEGALKIIGGKARLMNDIYCDGLGACLGKCPEDAITIEEREAEAFDEGIARQHKSEEGCGCNNMVIAFDRKKLTLSEMVDSALSQWPVQLALVPANAPFLKGADLLLVADCVPFAYGNFHADFVKDHTVLVACPKLDDFSSHQKKLTEILAQSDLKSLTVVYMEVPCCSGLTYMARQAINTARKNTPFKEVTVSIKGKILKPGS